MYRRPWQTPGTADGTGVSVETDAPAAPPAPAPVPASPEDEVQPVTVDAAPAEPAEPQEEDIAALQPNETPPASNPADEPDDQEVSIQDSPIAVEGDEDVLPRKRARIAALPQIGGEQAETSTTIVGKRVVPLDRTRRHTRRTRGCGAACGRQADRGLCRGIR